MRKIRPVPDLLQDRRLVSSRELTVTPDQVRTLSVVAPFVFRGILADVGEVAAAAAGRGGAGGGAGIAAASV